MKMNFRNALLASTIVGTLAATAAFASEFEWSYSGDTGPEFWGFLLDGSGNVAFPTCATGESQSPVNIGVVDDEDMSSIRFNYEPTPLVVINNTHTIEVEYEPGSSITVGGDTYGLLQFHFHSPSEHTEGGIAYPMEGHLVHARGVGDNVELAVVGFLIEEGAANPTLQAIWDVMPEEEGEVDAHGVTVDAADLLPGGDRDYYSYSGSLTTPPCSEGVRWMVLEQPIQASAEQIARFRELYPMNARPVEPLNGREVVLSDD